MPNSLTFHHPGTREIDARHSQDPSPLTALLGDLARAAALTTSVSSSAVVMAYAPDTAPDSERELLCSASDQFAATMTLVQHELQQGPYLDALAESMSVTVSDLTTEGWRWPVLALAARGHGLAAAHAEPLITPRSELLGVIAWYATTPGVLDAERCGGLGAQAREVTHTLALAIRLLDLGLRAPELPAALTARRVISRAVGLLMERFACDADAAFARLREEARLHRAAVHTIAAVLVDRAERSLARA